MLRRRAEPDRCGLQFRWTRVRRHRPASLRRYAENGNGKNIAEYLRSLGDAARSGCRSAQAVRVTVERMRKDLLPKLRGAQADLKRLIAPE